MGNDEDTAKLQVSAFLAELSQRTGHSEDELLRLVGTAYDFHERATRVQQYADHAARTAVSLVVAGTFGLLGWGIVHAIQSIVAETLAR